MPRGRTRRTSRAARARLPALQTAFGTRNGPKRQAPASGRGVREVREARASSASEFVLLNLLRLLLQVVDEGKRLARGERIGVDFSHRLNEV